MSLLRDMGYISDDSDSDLEMISIIEGLPSESYVQIRDALIQSGVSDSPKTADAKNTIGGSIHHASPYDFDKKIEESSVSTTLSTKKTTF